MDAMAQTVSPIPEGFRTITPHLTVDGAANYIDLLTRAFGAIEVHRSQMPTGKIMHATLRIGDSVVMLNDWFPEFGAKPINPAPWPFAIHLYVPDADAMFAQATAAGCKTVMPLADQFWGDRYGQVEDPAGFRWSIATCKEMPTAEEMEQRTKGMFGGA
jgi:PhnB protein